MAITLRAAGTWADSNATTQTVTLPTHSAGDLLIVVAAAKAATMANLDPTTSTSGWSRVAIFADGSTGAANGTGSVEQAIFYKEATSSSETNPVISWGTTSAPGLAVAQSWQKSASESWVIPVVVQAATNSATSISVTMGSNPGITSGDVGIGVHTTRDDSALTVPTWTATGATLAAVTISPATPMATGTSNDMAATMCYRTVTSGTASAAPVVTGTQAAAETGVTGFIRLRVLPMTTQSGSATADAILKATISGSVTADSVLQSTVAGSFTADAVIVDMTKFGSTTADAVLQGTTTASITADAILRMQPVTIPADSIIKASVGEPYYFAAWRTATTHVSSNGTIVGSTSADGGKTWSTPVTIVDHATLDVRDSAAVLLSDGRIAITFFYWDGSDQTNPSVVFSSDKGRTWGSPISLNTPYTGDTGITAPIIEVDSTTYLAPLLGRNSFTSGLRSCKMMRSTDSGATWSEYSTIATSGIADFVEPFAFYNPTKTVLYCFLRREDDGTIWRVRSFDDGATWDTRQQAFVGTGRPAGIWLTTDTILVAFRSSANNRALWRTSDDQGVTWTNAAVDLHTNTDMYVYAQWVKVNPHTLGVMYAVEVDSNNANVYFQTARINAADAHPTPVFPDSPLLLTPGTPDYSAFPALVVVNATDNSITADAILQKTTSGSVTANSVLKATQSGSVAADSVLKKTESQSFTADALLSSHVEQTLVADSILLKVTSTTFEADAILKKEQSATFTGDSVLLATVQDAVTADAILQLSTSDSVVADAVLLKLISDSFTADSILQLAQSSSITGDAILKASVESSFTADSWLISSQAGEGSFSADAVLLAVVESTFTASALLVTRTEGNFTADSILRQEALGSLTADAILLKVSPYSITADAVLRGSTSLTVDADAVLQKTETGSFTADAVLVDTGTTTSSFTADAILSKTAADSFTADAWISSGQTDPFEVTSSVENTLGVESSVESTLDNNPVETIEISVRSRVESTLAVAVRVTRN